VTAVQDFPISATIFTLGVGMAPSLSLKVSDKVFLDLKIIPSFLLADFEKVTINNPTLLKEDQNGKREYDLPEIDLAGTIQVRYLLKAPKKRRRSRE